MTKTWNSVIFMKSTKSMPDMNGMIKWDGVESIWSTMGEWDWCVKLDAKSSTPEKAHEIAAKMLEGNWATATQTSWWKQVAAK